MLALSLVLLGAAVGVGVGVPALALLAAASEAGLVGPPDGMVPVESMEPMVLLPA